MRHIICNFHRLLLRRLQCHTVVSAASNNTPLPAKLVNAFTTPHIGATYFTNSRFHNTNTPDDVNLNVEEVVYSTKKVNLVTPLFQQANKFLDRVAIVDGKGLHTYSDLLRNANDIANIIAGAVFGVDSMKISLSNTRIAYLCPNNAVNVATQWAIWMCGAVAVPLLKSQSPDDINYIIDHSECSVVITTPDLEEKLKHRSRRRKMEYIVLDEEVYPTYKTYLNDVTPEDHELGPWNPKLLEARKQQLVCTTREHSRRNQHSQRLSNNGFRYNPALIVYTSGTTGRPKGAVHTYASLQATIEGMVEAWQWTFNDVILHALPLNHAHGIFNALMTPLFCGAAVVMMPEFNAAKVWEKLLSEAIPGLNRSVNMFMGVPTMYAKLIAHHKENRPIGGIIATSRTENYVKSFLQTKIRLMVSGSAALPETVYKEWQEITGHELLERYGMTELGMALTNPLEGPRKPGCVGLPFPKVEVCIANPDVYSPTGYQILVQANDKDVTVTKDLFSSIGNKGEQGQLYVKGPNVFKCYYNNPQATTEAFTQDGQWFITGDTASYEDGVFRILGRTSVDIIKSGGYKISALDVERQLLEHEDISETVVVGLPDITWGQKVAAVVVLKNGATLELQQLRTWAKDRISASEIPSVLKVVDSIPRNAMGKVNKVNILDTIFEKEMKQHY